jgi:HAMP domain-containing protein
MAEQEGAAVVSELSTLGQFGLAVAGAASGAAGALFAAGKFFGRQGRQIEDLDRRLTAIESDRRSYARAAEVNGLKADIAERRQELDERMNNMATTRDLAAVREIVQVQSTAIQREIEQSRQERHSDRRVLDTLATTMNEVLREVRRER